VLPLGGCARQLSALYKQGPPMPKEDKSGIGGNKERLNKLSPPTDAVQNR